MTDQTAFGREIVPLTLDTAKERAAAIARELRGAARKSRASSVFVSGGGGFKARKGARLYFYGIVASFILMVLAPTVAASIYYSSVATDQYMTETRFALKSGESSVLDAFSGIAGISASQQAQDSQIITAYIKSRAMVEALDAAFDFRKLYGSQSVDYFSRFDAKDRIEDMVKYWNRRVDAVLETQSGIITVEVRAFTAEDSLKITRKIIELSEALINQMSERSRQSTLRQSREELDRAQANLSAASNAMQKMRNTEGILDATLVAQAANQVLVALKIELGAREQELAVGAGYLTPDAPQTRMLNARMANIREQIAKINAQLTDPTSGLLQPAMGADGKPIAPSNSLARSMSILERVQVDLTLAQQQYAGAAANYESARVDSETQKAYLTPFLLPTLAQKPIYPKRLWSWAIIVLPDILIWLVLLGVSFLIRDHTIG